MEIVGIIHILYWHLSIGEIMNIKNFKSKCRSAKLEEDAFEERYNKLQEEQKLYINYAPVRKFNWFKFEYEEYCPSCGKKLNKYTTTRYLYSAIVICDCGYEYAW